MRLIALVLATTVSGCTLIGASHMRTRAHEHNARRDEALAQGKPAPPAHDVGGRTVVGGLLGFTVDIAVVIGGVLLFVPRQD